MICLAPPRLTVAEAIKALEDAGVLSLVQRIKRVRVRVCCPDLFGAGGVRLVPQRTSNAYPFNDPGDVDATSVSGRGNDARALPRAARSLTAQARQGRQKYTLPGRRNLIDYYSKEPSSNKCSRAGSNRVASF
jgi:hypothetical protein